MEMNDLRYFCAVARTQNIRVASEEISISPSSLSKAIARLESELKVKLFHRVGRNIRLSKEGGFLQNQAKKILQLELQAKIDLLGQDTEFKAVIAASGLLLPYFGVPLAIRIKTLFPNVLVELQKVDEAQLSKEISLGNIHVGITAGSATAIDSKDLDTVKFQTVIGKRHPLFEKSDREIPVAEILEHDFVSIATGDFGNTNIKQSPDGWRDDKFPRKIRYLSSNIKTIESLVESGEAIAYLPSYLVHANQFISLAIPDCPYECKQRVRMITKDKRSHGWIRQLF